MTIYHATKICKAFDITEPTYRDWLNKGFITPTYPSEGQGSKASWDKAGVLSILLFRQLTAMGIKRSIVKDIINSIDVYLLDTEHRLIIQDGKVFIHNVLELPLLGAYTDPLKANTYSIIINLTTIRSLFVKHEEELL